MLLTSVFSWRLFRIVIFKQRQTRRFSFVFIGFLGLVFKLSTSFSNEDVPRGRPLTLWHNSAMQIHFHVRCVVVALMSEICEGSRRRSFVLGQDTRQNRHFVDRRRAGCAPLSLLIRHNIPSLYLFQRMAFGCAHMRSWSACAGSSSFVLMRNCPVWG